MNFLSKYLIESVIGKPQNIALYPGGFKFPHLGHFQIILEISKNPQIDEIIILIGPKEREGINQDQSYKIWEIYKKYIPKEIKIIKSEQTPVKDVYNIIKNNPHNFYYPIVGYRGESEDDKDLNRFDSFKNKFDNFKVIALKGEYNIRATYLRKLLYTQNKEAILKYIPEELNEEEGEQVLKILLFNQEIEEVLLPEVPKEKETKFWALYYNMFEILNQNLKKYFDLKDIFTGEKLEALNYFYKVIDQELIPLSESNLKRVKRLNENLNLKTTNLDYVNVIDSINEFIKEGDEYKIKSFPKVEFLEDEANAGLLLGKTAHYDPNSKTIGVYVTKRHPKDILRSYCHELIHYIQDSEGRINNIKTQNVGEDSTLEEIEKEAYLMGNILFRKWEESLK